MSLFGMSWPSLVSASLMSDFARVDPSPILHSLPHSKFSFSLPANLLIGPPLSFRSVLHAESFSLPSGLACIGFVFLLPACDKACSDFSPLLRSFTWIGLLALSCDYSGLGPSLTPQSCACPRSASLVFGVARLNVPVIILGRLHSGASSPSKGITHLRPSLLVLCSCHLALSLPPQGHAHFGFSVVAQGMAQLNTLPALRAISRLGLTPAFLSSGVVGASSLTRGMLCPEAVMLVSEVANLGPLLISHILARSSVSISMSGTTRTRLSVLVVKSSHLESVSPSKFITYPRPFVLSLRACHIGTSLFSRSLVFVRIPLITSGTPHSKSTLMFQSFTRLGVLPAALNSTSSEASVPAHGDACPHSAVSPLDPTTVRPLLPARSLG